MSQTKKVSIVTTTYNDAESLRQTIKQILSQDYKNIEYIIVDGASTDHTMEVIKEAQEELGDKLKWISEPDKGIYDALNKGFRMATGDILGCCFDEYTHPQVLSHMVEIMEQEGTDGVHGDLDYMDGDRIVRKWRQGQGKIRYGWMPGHPTLYLKREVYETYGYYKTDYRISADYEFMIRILTDDKVRLSYLPEVLIKMSHGGTSTKSLSAYLAGMKEGHRALKENGVSWAWFTDLCRILRVLVQFVRK
ncbi:MAG: glycosyltransferase [Lachnospiraceae bacterium]|nr:glycosyltransferase [Lachnospiraceae bacterium]